MPFEHFLEPDGTNGFPPDAIAAMHDYVRALPHHQWPDGSYSIYTDDEARDQAVALRRELGGPDYVHALVAVDAPHVLVSVVGDRETDLVLRRFVEWVQERWPARLYSIDKEVLPEELTAFRYPPEA
jgi:predicted RNase H-like nuclease